MNHKWKNNKCVRCGINRKRKAWKQLMAIVNHPPWNAYMRGVDWWYYDNIEGIKLGDFNRPNCQNSSQEDNQSTPNELDKQNKK